MVGWQKTLSKMGYAMNQGDNYNSGKVGEKDSWEVMQDNGFVRPTPAQRKNLEQAFSEVGKKFSKKGFDLLDVRDIQSINDLEKLRQSINDIKVYELKTAGRNRKSEVSDNWKGLGFTLTSSEKINSDSLGNQYKFIFLNLKTNKFGIFNLSDWFNEAKSNIYPTYSVFITENLTS